VTSRHGLAQTTYTKSDQQIPFFMLPSAGSGSTLRGFKSQRFRDQNSLLLQAEWRIMVNRFLYTAVFYDAGKVTARRTDLNLDGLRSDVGFGARFHGPFATPLRIEVAHGNEGWAFIFGAHPAFGVVAMSKSPFIARFWTGLLIVLACALGLLNSAVS